MSEDDKKTEHDAAVAAELQEILAAAAPQGEVEPPSNSPDDGEDNRKLRYYCAGVKRKNEITGKARCNYQARDRWYGACPKCRNLYACLPIPKKKTEFRTERVLDHKTMAKVAELTRCSTGVPELDRVLGGGVVLGSTLLFGGSRGCGKSTVLLQACAAFAQRGMKACYAGADMPEHLFLAYAKRLGISSSKIKIVFDPQGLDVDQLLESVVSFGAQLLVVDALQNCYLHDKKGEMGNPSMVEAVTEMLISFAPIKSVAVVAIGHLGKAGDYAGSEKVQHMMDGLVRMDVKWIGVDNFGKPIDSMVRQISMDSKSRIGASNVTSLVEMTEDGVIPISMAGIRRIQGW